MKGNEENPPEYFGSIYDDWDEEAESIEEFEERINDNGG